MAQAISKAVRLGILTCIAAFATVNVTASVPEPEAIDIGLSVKWADRNLGAPSPLEEGGYFSFGEVEEKDYYHWDTYMYCYNGNLYSHVDFGVESLCGTEYDAAHVILGGNWRMPSVEEFLELVENCTIEHVNVEPLNYIRVTGPNGVYIDLPYTGTMSLDRVIHQNQDLAMWSGSFYVEEGDEDDFYYYINAPFFLGGNFIQDFINVYEGNPYFGLQIRPVYVETSSVESLSSSSKTIEAIYTIDGRKISENATDLPAGIYIYRYSDGSSKRHLAK